MAYASKTSVSVEKTEAEIKALCRKYGADRFASFEETGLAAITFEMRGRRILFKLPLPDRDADEFKRTESRRQLRSPDARLAAWEQACRSRWRALFLCIKAKLESVESNIETFEDAFLAQTVLPNGHTVGESIGDDLQRTITSGQMQPLLPGPRPV